MNDSSENEKNVPFGQRLFDKPMLWLVAGFVTMLVFYTLWGLYEILTLPTANF